jgi:hypothetical protein
LNRDGTALAALSESYLRLLAAAGVIDPELRDSALAAERISVPSCRQGLRRGS